MQEMDRIASTGAGGAGQQVGAPRLPWQAPDVSIISAADAESSPNPVIGDGPFSFGS